MIAGQTFQSFARVVLFSLLAAGALPAGAQAGDKWRLVQSTGQVTAGGAGLVPVAVRPNDALPKNGWLQTGPNGSAVLAHDRDTIIIGPLSRVQLPDETKAGNTQVIQSLGSALYQIGKEAAPHFQVDTPYLAAIVKGTTFVVSVGSDSARVDVTEGLVEVASPDGSSVEYIRPGHAGLVSHADGTSGRVNVIESRESREGLPSAAPGLLEQAEERGEREVLDSNQSDKVVVATSIGQVDLNIRAVSEGLASGVVQTSVTSSRARLDGGGSDRQYGKDRENSEAALTAKTGGGEASAEVPRLPRSAVPSPVVPVDVPDSPSDESPDNPAGGGDRGDHGGNGGGNGDDNGRDDDGDFGNDRGDRGGNGGGRRGRRG